MPLTVIDVNRFLSGIVSHARAGNFVQARRQARLLVRKMKAAIREDPVGNYTIQSALPAVQSLIADAGQSDGPSMLAHVRDAQDALGIVPGATASWSGTE
jgi:hypothetical protein